MDQNNTLAALVGAISSATVTLLGVDYYAVLWGFVGAMLALTQVERMERRRALVYVALSTLIGAACGTAAIAYTNQPVRAFLILASIVGGFGANVIISALLQVALNRIKGLGGTPT